MSATIVSPTSGAPAPPVASEVVSLQVSLPQMLDLALGTPEVGTVNLNILHNFLHILLRQINLGSMKVEYRGDDANRIKTMVSSLKAGPSFYFQEYSIIDGSGNVEQAVPTDGAAGVKVDVVTDDIGAHGEDMIRTVGTKQQIGPGAEGEHETVIFVEPIVDGVAPTALGFKRLEQTVNELQQRFQALEELATNPELVERIKGKMTDPLTDVWQIINITKRLDASEQGIDKLTSMVQDVFKGDMDVVATQDTSQLEARITALEDALNQLGQTVKNLEVIANVVEEEEKVVTAEETPTVEEEQKTLPTQQAQPTEQVKQTQQTQQVQQTQQRISLSQLLGGINITEMHEDVVSLQKEVSQIRAELSSLREEIAKASIATEAKKATNTENATVKEEALAQQVAGVKEPKEQQKQKEEEKQEARNEPPEKIKAKDTEDAPAEKRVRSKLTLAKHDETIDSGTLGVINERLTKLEKDVACLNNKIESAPVPGVGGSAELDELVSKIQSVQVDMEKLNETADRLIDDRENREIHLTALLEQVELLKTIKADREDLEEALADKADAQAINRKVSYDHFDAACDDLAQGLEDAINKLGKQESIWQEALDEVQKEIEGKVDKIEITPLKDFVSTRLKTLQEKLKHVAQMRQEAEAAGTKKMLKDVQCISCDKNVVMKMEDTHKLRMEPLPCSMSMKPYLTYELDQVRKQHRRLPHSRNMIQFEAALQEEARKQKSARSDTLAKTPRDHLCNRYCGGSHTVTTPQQRVMRMGHFLAQWGPEIVQLTEGVVKGTDGRMYRSRPMPGKFDVCGPAYCESGDEVRPQERPVAIPPRKSVERQPSLSSRRRSSKKQTKDTSKELIEEIPETSRVEADVQEPDPLPPDPRVLSDRVIRYYDEEEMEEDD